jgi:hypothetical protein
MGTLATLGKRMKYIPFHNTRSVFCYGTYKSVPCIVIERQDGRGFTHEIYRIYRRRQPEVREWSCYHWGCRESVHGEIEDYFRRWRDRYASPFDHRYRGS